MIDKQAQAIPGPYQRWLAAISIAVGYLWLLSGLDKIYSPDFVANFGESTKTQIQSVHVFGPFQFILKNFVIPHGVFFGNVIEYSEIIIGLVLILGGLWSIFYYTRVGRVILAIANTGAFFLILSIILSVAMPLPWINPFNAYAPGMSVDYLVLLVTFFSAIAYFTAD